ncbi:MAG: hypothetical protein ABIK89_08500, partial [Planctomycetota bacterium]
ASGPRPGGAAAGGPSPAAEPVVQAVAVDEEPILAWLRQTFWKVRVAWEESHLDTATKIVLLGAGLVALCFTAGGWIPILVFALIVYGCYWVARAMVLSLSPPQRHERYFSTDREPALRSGPAQGGQSPPGPSPPGQPAHGARRRRERPPTMPRWARRERPANALVLKSKRERVTELTGSMLAGALVAMTMCVVMVMLNGFRTRAVVPPELWAWLMLVSIAGTWAIQIPSKFWEGNRGEPLVRRFILMVVGLGVGVLAAGLAVLLKVHLPYDPEFSEPHKYVLPGFYAAGAPLLMAYMACFASLFVTIRWWRQADPLRATRMSLWGMVFCVVMAWLVATLWHFPQTWLMMTACATSVSVQLTSPWLHPRWRYPSDSLD